MTFEIVKAEEKDYELFASIIQEVYEAMEEKEWFAADNAEYTYEMLKYSNGVGYKVVYAGLTSSFRWLFATVFGFIYAPLVITGLHHMTNAIDLQLMAEFGGTMLWPMIALSNIAQGSAVLGMIYLQKHNEEAKQISIPACISCYLGVTEPAIFGVNLKRGFPFISAMIGSAIAATVSVGSNVMANSIGVGGIPGILSIQPQYMGRFAVCMLITMVVPFVLTVVVGKKKDVR